MNRSSSVILVLGAIGALALAIIYASLLERHGAVNPILATVRGLRLLFSNPTILVRRAPGADGETLYVMYRREGIPAGGAPPPDPDQRPIAEYLFQTYFPEGGAPLAEVQVACKYTAGGACSRREVESTFRLTRAEYERRWRK
ncbi:MAG: hypothetical protein HZA54_10485 [Planctomycetes bacterium]|nr:hypothetical protein [Planctomycetota bacterium]